MTAVLALVFLVLPVVVGAQPADGLGQFQEAAGIASGPTLPVILGRIIQVVLAFLGIVAIIIIIYAGLRYMRSDGDEAKIEKAKKTIIMATIGLVIMFSSFAIVTFLFDRLFGVVGDPGGGGGPCVSGEMRYSGVGDCAVSQCVNSVWENWDYSGCYFYTSNQYSGVSGFVDDNLVGPDGDSWSYEVSRAFSGTVSLPSSASLQVRGYGHYKGASNLIEDMVLQWSGVATGTAAFSPIDNQVRQINGADYNVVENSSASWNTSSYAAQATSSLQILLSPEDSNHFFKTLKVKFIADHCFNGVKDQGETQADCGGECGACPGESCNAATSGTCQANDDACRWGVCSDDSCLCLAPPTVDYISPSFDADGDTKLYDSRTWNDDVANGASGNLVSVWGRNFGQATGTVVFIDKSDPSRRFNASFPQQPCDSVWSDQQVIVQVPEGLNAVDVSSTAGLIGNTSTNYRVEVRSATGLAGSGRDFQANTINRPGICQATPGKHPATTTVSGANFPFATGAAKEVVWTLGSYVGGSWLNGFLSGARWSDVDVTSTAETAWSANSVVDSIPQSASTNTAAVRIFNGSEYSNYFNFNLSSGGVGESCGQFNNTCAINNGLCQEGLSCDPDSCLCEVGPEAICEAGEIGGNCEPDDAIPDCSYVDVCKADGSGWTCSPKSDDPDCRSGDALGLSGLSLYSWNFNSVFPGTLGAKCGVDVWGVCNPRGCVAGLKCDVEGSASTTPCTCVVDDSVCSVGETEPCPAVGTCQAEKACVDGKWGECKLVDPFCYGVVPQAQQSVFSWLFTFGAGDINGAPYVIEDCNSSNDCKVRREPVSPSPWFMDHGNGAFEGWGTSNRGIASSSVPACVNSSIQARFSQKMFDKSFNADTVRLYKNNAGTLSQIALDGAVISLGSDGKLLTVNGVDFDISSVYQLALFPGIVSDANKPLAFNPKYDANAERSFRDCADGSVYCWNFTTRDTDERCKEGCVDCYDDPTRMFWYGQTSTNQALLTDQDNACLALDPWTYNWNWSVSPQNIAGTTTLNSYVSISRLSRSRIFDPIQFSTALGDTHGSDDDYSQLLGWWHMDSNDDMPDYSNNGFNLARHGAPGTVEGRFGRAAGFDGSDDYYYSNSVPAWPGAGDLSLTAWFRADDSAAARKIIGVANNNQNWFLASPLNSGRVRLSLRGAGGEYNLDSDFNSTVWNDSQWHHIAIVRDYGQQLYLYFDGELVGQRNDPAGSMGELTDFVIGGPWNLLPGETDEVTAWSRTLSASNIADLYQYNAIKLRPATTTINTFISGNPANAGTCLVDNNFTNVIVAEDRNCQGDTVQSPTPYNGTTDACTNALVAARFNRPIVDSGISLAYGGQPGNIIVEECDQEPGPETVCTPFTFNGVSPSVRVFDYSHRVGYEELISGGPRRANPEGFIIDVAPENRTKYENALSVINNGYLEQDTWYRVVILGGENGIRGSRIDGDQDTDTPQGYLMTPSYPSNVRWLYNDGQPQQLTGDPDGRHDYYWTFKTGNSSCEVDTVKVQPANYFLRLAGETKDYNAMPQAANCNILARCLIDWDWWSLANLDDSHDYDPQGSGVGTGNPIASISKNRQTPDVCKLADGGYDNFNLVDPVQTATAGADGLTHILAMTDAEKEGYGKLQVGLEGFSITNHYPEDPQCINSPVKLSFSLPADVSTVRINGANRNVTLYRCADDDCASGLTQVPLYEGAPTGLGQTGEPSRTVSLNTYSGDEFGLLPGENYRVVVNGGNSGIRSYNGLSINNLNYAFGGSATNTYSWTFKMADNARECGPEIFINPCPNGVWRVTTEKETQELRVGIEKIYSADSPPFAGCEITTDGILASNASFFAKVWHAVVGFFKSLVGVATASNYWCPVLDKTFTDGELAMMDKGNYSSIINTSLTPDGQLAVIGYGDNNGRRIINFVNHGDDSWQGGTDYRLTLEVDYGDSVETSTARTTIFNSTSDINSKCAITSAKAEIWPIGEQKANDTFFCYGDYCGAVASAKDAFYAKDQNAPWNDSFDFGSQQGMAGNQHVYRFWAYGQSGYRLRADFTSFDLVPFTPGTGTSVNTRHQEFNPSDDYPLEFYNGARFVTAGNVQGYDLYHAQASDSQYLGQATGTVRIMTFPCANPWPDFENFPFVDGANNCNGPVAGGAGAATCPNTNFSTFYCRDQGQGNACVGGANAGKDCKVSADCPGGICQNNTDDDLPSIGSYSSTTGRVSVGINGLSNSECNPATDKCVTKLKEFLFSSDTSTKPGAVGIRVMSNDNHLSALDWYRDWFNVQGSPSALTIDGYRGVQDGRTVYINAANSDSGSSSIFTNVYLMSYSQDAGEEMKNVFSQMASNFSFNYNLMDSADVGNCYSASQYYCLVDSDCPAGDYCLSDKAALTRDTRRVEDIQQMRAVLDSYVGIKRCDNDHSRRCFDDSNCYGGGKCANYSPDLKSGSYIMGKTYSVWPSWQETLGKTMGSALPTDPINKLYGCSDPYNPVTCWDQDAKAMSVPSTDSSVYVYAAYNGVSGKVFGKGEFDDGGQRWQPAWDRTMLKYNPFNPVWESILGQIGSAPTTCGNGQVDPDENCSNCPLDFKCLAGEICNASNVCVPKSQCGNGVKEGIEECDGVANCNNDCTLRDNYRCSNAGCTATELICGNGQVDPGEQCDGGNLNGKTCANLIPGTCGTLSCNANCRFATSSCAFPTWNCSEWEPESCNGTTTPQIRSCSSTLPGCASNVAKPIETRPCNCQIDYNATCNGKYGPQQDNCGGTVNCGTCPNGLVADEGQCKLIADACKEPHEVVDFTSYSCGCVAGYRMNEQGDCICDNTNPLYDCSVCLGDPQGVVSNGCCRLGETGIWPDCQTAPAQCGNGLTETGEQCDLGLNNYTSNSGCDNHCNLTCSADEPSVGPVLFRHEPWVGSITFNDSVTQTNIHLPIDYSQIRDVFGLDFKAEVQGSIGTTDVVFVNDMSGSMKEGNNQIQINNSTFACSKPQNGKWRDPLGNNTINIFDDCYVILSGTLTTCKSQKDGSCCYYNDDAGKWYKYTKTVFSIDPSGDYTNNGTIPCEADSDTLSKIESLTHTRLGQLKIALSESIQTILGPTLPNARVGLVTYSGQSSTSEPLTSDIGKLTTFIESMVAKGETYPNVGLNRANAMLASSTATNKFLVLMGDGAVTASTNNTNLRLANNSATASRGIVDAFYSIGFGVTPTSTPARQLNSWSSNASYSDCTPPFCFTSQDNIVQIFRDVADEIVDQSRKSNISVQVNDSGTVLEREVRGDDFVSYPLSLDGLSSGTNVLKLERDQNSIEVSNANLRYCPVMMDPLIAANSAKSVAGAYEEKKIPFYDKIISMIVRPFFMLSQLFNS